MIYIILLLAVLFLMGVLLFFATVRVRVISRKIKDEFIFKTNTSVGYGSLRFNISEGQSKPSSIFNKIKFIPKDIQMSSHLDISKLKSLFSKNSDSDSTYKVKQYYNKNKKGIGYLVKRIKTYEVFLELKFGLDNASSTAITYGLISTFITNILAAIKRITWVDIKKIDIVPIFNEIVLEYDFNCIIEARLGNIIIALIAVKKKERGVVFGTTNSSVNENNS